MQTNQTGYLLDLSISRSDETVSNEDVQEVLYNIVEKLIREDVSLSLDSGWRKDWRTSSLIGSPNIKRARFCMGGRLKGQTRRPGIIEEVISSFEDQRPIYLSGILGGATKQIILALENKNTVADLFPDISNDHPAWSPENIWRTFSQLGIVKLAKSNGLSVEENHKLFHTGSSDEALGLVLTGLKRIYT